jgi:hypothetical protein
MAVAIRRRSARTIEVAPRATLRDRHLGRLDYLHGWWYGARDCVGFHAVRLRLPGDVSGPNGRAREALLALERDAQPLTAQLHPHLWAEYLAAREARDGPTLRLAHCRDVLHEHFRLDAVCAAPFGEDRLVELTIEPRWAPGSVLGAYLEGRRLLEFRRHVRAWRTPR